MDKAMRELQRVVSRHPGAVIERGKGVTLVARSGARKSLGSGKHVDGLAGLERWLREHS